MRSNALDRNPFVLPADEEVFRMREEEKSRKAQDRIARRGQKVQRQHVHYRVYNATTVDTNLRAVG